MIYILNSMSHDKLEKVTVSSNYWIKLCAFFFEITLSTLLEAQMVKNLPAMWETQVLSLGWEDPLEEGMAANTSILAWRILMDREA